MNLGPKDYESSALTAELMSQRNDENISETIAQCQLLHTKIAKNMKKILFPRPIKACACSNKANLRTKNSFKQNSEREKSQQQETSPPRRTLALQALRALAPTKPILERKNSFKQNSEREKSQQQDSPHQGARLLRKRCVRLLQQIQS